MQKGSCHGALCGPHLRAEAGAAAHVDHLQGWAQKRGRKQSLEHLVVDNKSDWPACCHRAGFPSTSVRSYLQVR